jgi:hypothetical protein
MMIVFCVWFLCVFLCVFLWLEREGEVCVWREVCAYVGRFVCVLGVLWMEVMGEGCKERGVRGWIEG